MPVHRNAALFSRFAVRAVAPGTAVLLVALAALGTACDSFDLNTGRKATLTYTEDASAAYNEALESFRSRDWEDARALLGEVKKLFPYSRFARLAELRLADINFEQEKFSDAISGYREFVSSHRGDQDTEYARYRITKSLFRDIDDTFLLPPLEERDQATTLEAFKELRNFLREFPKSRYRADARYMLEVVTSRIIRHELYVARFYLKRDSFEAAVARIDHATKGYPGSTLEPEAMVLKGETLLKMRRYAEAQDVFEGVIRDYGGPFATAAKNFLADMKTRPTPPPPPPPPPPAPPAPPASSSPAAPPAGGTGVR